MKRRGYLGALAFALAGCTGGSGESTPTPKVKTVIKTRKPSGTGGPAANTQTSSPTPTRTPTRTPTPTPTPTPSVKKRAREYEYDEMFRNIEAWEGIYIHEPQAQIFQVQEDSGDYVFLMSVTEMSFGTYDDDIIAYWQGDRFLEDDIVEFWGQSIGPYTYTTVLGRSARSRRSGLGICS